MPVDHPRRFAPLREQDWDDSARPLIDRQSQPAMVLQCAETVGIVDTVLAITVEWTRDCYSFGRPLAAAARNVIAERVLGLPREYAADRGVPFNQVRHNKAQYARRQRR